RQPGILSSIITMATSLKIFGCATVALVAALSFSHAQTAVSPAAPIQAASPAAKASENSPVLLTQTSTSAATPAAAVTKTTTTTSTASSPAGTTTTVEPENVTESGGVGVREFQGDDVGQVLRLLARQAKLNMVVG